MPKDALERLDSVLVGLLLMAETYQKSDAVKEIEELITLVRYQSYETSGQGGKARNDPTNSPTPRVT